MDDFGTARTIFFSSEDIRVALSATKFSVLPDQIVKLNLPVCVAESRLAIEGKDIEKMEHFAAQNCLNMAKTVFIDESRNYIFIGINPSDETSGLVIYTAHESEYSVEFFKRWKDTKMMLFEFQVSSLKQSLFTAKGLWIADSWKFLDIIPTPKIGVIEK